MLPIVLTHTRRWSSVPTRFARHRFWSRSSYKLDLDAAVQRTKAPLESCILKHVDCYRSNHVANSELSKRVLDLYPGSSIADSQVKISFVNLHLDFHLLILRDRLWLCERLIAFRATLPMLIRGFELPSNCLEWPDEVLINENKVLDDRHIVLIGGVCFWWSWLSVRAIWCCSS